MALRSARRDHPLGTGADRGGDDLTSRPTPLHDQLDRLYAVRFSPSERTARAGLWRTLCDAFFAHYVGPEATVLDLGAGYCDFINHVQARRRIAVDVNPETVHAAAAGVEVHPLPLERLADALPADSVDLAFASNVLEHLRTPEELLNVLDGVRRVLRPTGLLVIVQPNVRVLGGAFWDFVDHTLPLSDRGMAEALRVSGFRIRERRGRFLPYTTKAWLPRWPWLVRAYLALRPAQWLFGRQMLIVAERAR